MSDTKFGESFKKIVEDLAQEVQDSCGGTEDEPSVVPAPIRRKAKVEPRVVRVAARFSDGGGSLDRRAGDTDRWIGDTTRRSGLNSSAGDLAVPASTTWSNRTVAEAVAGKGNRNNRSVAEHVFGKANDSGDRVAEKKLGWEKGYFSSKS